MKYLGVDYGTKKVGIATSDDEGQFAFPHSIVSHQEAVATIEALAHTENITTIIVGQSVASNGLENETQKRIRSFIEKLEQAGLVVILQDEGFSSVEAHRYQTKKGDRDDSAAAIILQRFLDKQKK